MANLEIAIRTWTIAQPSISAVFGERFHWNKVPDTPVFPYMRVTTVNDNPMYHQQGSGLGKTTLQIDVVHDDKLAGNAAADVVFALFDGKRMVIDVFNVRTLVKNVPSSWEADQRYFRRIIEVEIGYVTNG